jgi:hypothetical protein
VPSTVELRFERRRRHGCRSIAVRTLEEHPLSSRTLLAVLLAACLVLFGSTFAPAQASLGSVKVLTADDARAAGRSALAAVVVEPSPSEVAAILDAVPAPDGFTGTRLVLATATTAMVTDLQQGSARASVTIHEVSRGAAASSTLIVSSAVERAADGLHSTVTVGDGPSMRSFKAAAADNCSTSCAATKNTGDVVYGACLPSPTSVWFDPIVSEFADPGMTCDLLLTSFMLFEAMTCLSMTCAAPPMAGYEGIKCDVSGCTVGLQSNGLGPDESSISSHITWWRNYTAATRPDGAIGQTWTNAYSIGRLSWTLQPFNDYVRHYSIRLNGDPSWWVRCTDSIYITMVMYFNDGSWVGFPERTAGKSYDTSACGLTPP